MDETVIRALRAQAWARAKGELEAVLVTYSGGNRREGQFEEMDAAVKQFIKHVEHNGLQE